MLASSMSTMAILLPGSRDEARTPKSYATRSRLWIHVLFSANRKAIDMTRPANQSVFQKLCFMEINAGRYSSSEGILHGTRVKK